MQGGGRNLSHVAIQSDSARSARTAATTGAVASKRASFVKGHRGLRDRVTGLALPCIACYDSYRDRSGRPLGNRAGEFYLRSSLDVREKHCSEGRRNAGGYRS